MPHQVASLSWGLDVVLVKAVGGLGGMYRGASHHVHLRCPPRALPELQMTWFRISPPPEDSNALQHS